MELWHGYEIETFCFEDRTAHLVFPKAPRADRAWLLKTEYWGAFPQAELALVEKGFYLACVENESRLAPKSDCDVKARFCKYLQETYGLKEKCVPVGMSCGGAHAVRFAGYYPQLVQCMFIDAPVLNFASYPGKIGHRECEYVWEREFVKTYPNVIREDLPQFPHHPINMASILVEHQIPIIMVYGLEDQTVIYKENGKLLEKAYENTGLLKVVPVRYRGHHPHGMLEDQTVIVDFILNHV